MHSSFFLNPSGWCLKFSQLLPQPSPASVYKGWTVSQGDSHVSCQEASWSLKNKAPFLWEPRHTCNVSKPVPVNFGLGWWPAGTAGPISRAQRWGTGTGLGSANGLAPWTGRKGAFVSGPHLVSPSGLEQRAEVWHLGKEATDRVGQWHWPLTCFDARKGLMDPWVSQWDLSFLISK